MLPDPLILAKEPMSCKAWEVLLNMLEAVARASSVHAAFAMAEASRIRAFLGCGILTRENAGTLSLLFTGKKVLEPFSGNGLFACHLRDIGVDVTAVDNGRQSWEKVFARDVTGDAVAYARENLSRFGAVLMSWPPPDCAAPAEILRLMEPGQILVHLGEDGEGSGATDGFFTILRDQFEPVEEASEALQEYGMSHDGMHDCWSVYVKKEGGNGR